MIVNGNLITALVALSTVTTTYAAPNPNPNSDKLVQNLVPRGGSISSYTSGNDIRYACAWYHYDDVNRYGFVNVFIQKNNGQRNKFCNYSEGGAWWEKISGIHSGGWKSYVVGGTNCYWNRGGDGFDSAQHSFDDMNCIQENADVQYALSHPAGGGGGVCVGGPGSC